MENSKLTLKTAELIQKQFGLSFPKETDELDWAKLKSFLERALKEKLDHDMAGLLQIFYRIDLEEQKVKAIIGTAPAEEIHELLADLIIERQKQKILIREKYGK